MKCTYFQCLGKRRQQEDAYYISSDLNLLAICDGVGGSENGGQASRLVTAEIKKLYSTFKIADMESFKDFSGMIVNTLSDFHEYDMSTTITMLFINGNEAYIANMGDSRIYYISSVNKKWFVTKDHSIVQELYEAGIILSEEEMKTHPMRNRITRAISSGHVIDYNDISFDFIDNILPGDHFILGTDGVFEHFTHESITNLFVTSVIKNIEDTTKEMEVICLQHSQDNSTCIILEI